MRRAFLIGLLVTASLFTHAQIAQVWIGMPDSLCPYLNIQQRKLLLDNALKGVFDSIPNQLGGSSQMEAVDKANNSLRVRLTRSLTMQLSLRVDTLHLENSTIQLEQTLCAPICSTLFRQYSLSWILLAQTRSKWDAEQSDEEKEQLF